MSVIGRINDILGEPLISEKKFLLFILLSLLIVFGGAAGYMSIEGWSFLDAMFMTVITLATVGYSDYHMSPLGRIFTIFLIFIGCGYILYIAGAAVQFMIEGRIRILMGRKKLDNKIKRLRKHHIVCGYGRIGRVLTNILRENNSNVVVVEQNPEAVKEMDKDGVLYISGDATDESNLEKAGIENAIYLVAALATDTDNVFLVLTARQLNPHIYIMARAGSYKSKNKLLTAGADKVEYPYDMGANSMAMGILRPTVTSFLEMALGAKDQKIQIEELRVYSSSKLVNVMLKNSGIRQKYNLIIIAIKKEDDGMIFNPYFDAIFQPNDTVIVLGRLEDLKKFEKDLNP